MFSALNRNLVRAIPSIALIWLVAGCQSDDPTSQIPDPITQVGALTWVAIEPTQCMTNPWEEDWLLRNGGNYQDYPKDYSTPGLEPGEIAIIKDYYRRQGVVVSNTGTAPKYELVCAACSCPEGHTMFLLVRDGDVETMIGFGYRVESPADGD